MIRPDSIYDLPLIEDGFAVQVMMNEPKDERILELAKEVLKEKLTIEMISGAC
jgi:hypothetical protein